MGLLAGTLCFSVACSPPRVMRPMTSRSVLARRSPRYTTSTMGERRSLCSPRRRRRTRSPQRSLSASRTYRSSAPQLIACPPLIRSSSSSMNRKGEELCCCSIQQTIPSGGAFAFSRNRKKRRTFAWRLSLLYGTRRGTTNPRGSECLDGALDSTSFFVVVVAVVVVVVVVVVAVVVVEVVV